MVLAEQKASTAPAARYSKDQTVRNRRGFHFLLSAEEMSKREATPSLLDRFFRLMNDHNQVHHS